MILGYLSDALVFVKLEHILNLLSLTVTTAWDRYPSGLC